MIAQLNVTRQSMCRTNRQIFFETLDQRQLMAADLGLEVPAEIGSVSFESSRLFAEGESTRQTASSPATKFSGATMYLAPPLFRYDEPSNSFVYLSNDPEPAIGISGIDSIAQASGNLVRIQIVWMVEDKPNGVPVPGAIPRGEEGLPRELADDAYRLFIDNSLPLLTSALQTALEQGVKVVIDLHTPPGARATNKALQYRTDLFSDDPKLRDPAQNLFEESWRKITNIAKSYPNVIGYDLLNEPAYRKSAEGLKQFERSMNQVTKVIRQVDPTTPVIVESWHGHVDQLNDTFVRVDDPFVIYSVHPYAQNDSVLRKIEKDYRGTERDRNAIKNYFQDLIQFQSTNDVPIYIGEFADSLIERKTFVDQSAPKSTDTINENAIPFVHDMAQFFDEQGWLWTYHANNPASLFNPNRIESTEIEKALAEQERVLGKTLANANAAATQRQPRMQLSNGTLTIHGTSQSDRVSIDQRTLANGSIWIVATRLGETYEHIYAPKSEITSIVFQGRKGDDWFVNNSFVSASGTLGAGHDKVISYHTTDRFRGQTRDTFKQQAVRVVSTASASRTAEVMRLSKTEYESVTRVAATDGVLQWQSIEKEFALVFTPRSGLAGLSEIEVYFAESTTPEIFDVEIEPVSLVDGVLTIAGSDAADRVVISSSQSQVSVHRNAAQWQFDSASIRSIVFDGGNGNDFVQNDTAIVMIASGGTGNDVLIGGSASNRLDGGQGNDRIVGGAADDWLVGGPGDDVMDGQMGNDSIFGDDGNDRIWGREGQDEIWGGAGDDWITGGTGDDLLHGNEGADEIHGQHGNDRIYGDQGNDSLYGGRSQDHIEGGAGNDLIDGGAHNDVLLGQEGHDTIMGGDGDDLLRGGAGADSINGGSGNDLLYGDDGNDTIDGMDGDDYLAGGNGADRLAGQAGDDELHGNDGDDTLYGGKGSDRLWGGAGYDLVDGQGGNDWLDGHDDAWWKRRLNGFVNWIWR